MKKITRDELIKNNKPLIIAGPCAVESRTQIRTIAKELSKMGVKILRCQLWKPRTDPASFQGVGLRGLRWIEEIKKEHNEVLITTEITDKDQIGATKGIVDILWVGARNMQNYELLKAVARDSRPVILKRGLIATVDEWIRAAKYIGLDKVILCERGIRTGADSMRFTLDVNGALVAKHDHRMPVIIDPSHTAGRADMVPYLAYAGIAAGMDGIVAEVHHQPEKALCDASQQILPEVFRQIIENVNTISQLKYQKRPVESVDFSLQERDLSKQLTKKPARTLLSLGVRDRVGLLRDILTVFADFDINLTKLKSKHSKLKGLDYYFEVEVESAAKEKRLTQALKILREFCPEIKILGEY